MVAYCADAPPPPVDAAAAAPDAAVAAASWVATMHDDEIRVEEEEDVSGVEVGIMDRTALDRDSEREDVLLLVVPDGGIDMMIRSIQAGTIESRYYVVGHFLLHFQVSWAAGTRS